MNVLNLMSNKIGGTADGVDFHFESPMTSIAVCFGKFNESVEEHFT